MKKLSEMNTSELMDTLCRIAEPVGKIFADPAVGDAFARVYKATQEKSSPLHFYALCASELMPVLMGEEHRGNVLKVLACIKGVTPEALEKQNGMVLRGFPVSSVKTHSPKLLTTKPLRARWNFSASSAGTEHLAAMLLSEKMLIFPLLQTKFCRSGIPPYMLELVNGVEPSTC